MSAGASKQPPLSPREAWISDGRQVLHFRPNRWDRWSQQLQITSGELLQYQTVPSAQTLLETEPRGSMRLWGEKRLQGW